MHLWSHKVRFAPEGVCGREIHYFSFCLLLLCAAQQLKGSDQPTITIHNGFSASSTSLEACLRSGLSPCPPGSGLHHPWFLWVCVCARAWAVYVCGYSGPWLWLWQRKTPLKRSGVSQCDRGPLSLSDHATTGAPGSTASCLDVGRISPESGAESPLGLANNKWRIKGRERHLCVIMLCRLAKESRGLTFVQRSATTRCYIQQMLLSEVTNTGEESSSYITIET